ncbi:MAG: hypothetical protein RL490_2398 [Pseudomonadota bacterium]|jgi:ABC-type branched-subunit amino acid transport system permease subunit
MITITLLAGMIVGLVLVLAGPPLWKRRGAALLLVCLLLAGALYYVLGQATRGHP